MVRWWVDRGVDGLRMDVVNLLSKDPALPDGEVAPGELYGDGFRFYGHGPRIHEFLHEPRSEVLAGRDGPFVIIGETPGVTIEQARLFTDPARRGLDMVFQFEHMGVDQGSGGKWDVRPLDVCALEETFRRRQDGLADCGWNSLCWCNHDQPRPVSRFGDGSAYWRESATALATVLHLQRGTPFVYRGEEIGMRNHTFAVADDFTDIESANHYRAAVARGESPTAVLGALRRMSRDNARTPFQWDAGPAAGFSSGTPWMAVNADHHEVNVGAERGVKGSVYEHYRSLIALWHTEPAVVNGDFTMLLPEHPAVFSYLRSVEGTALLVAANLFGDPQTVVIADAPGDAAPWSEADVVVTNQLGDHTVSHELVWLDAGRLALRPWEAVVLRPAPSPSRVARTLRCTDVAVLGATGDVGRQVCTELIERWHDTQRMNRSALPLPWT
jgi:oligo-1,6-glucosidase